MSSLVLNLSKSGEPAPKLQLNLSKSECFTVKLSWDGETDIDLHALVCLNSGLGAKAGSLEDILSTYNVRRRIGGQDTGLIFAKDDGSFEIHGGALVHSADALDGRLDGCDEWIRIDPSKLPPMYGGTIEIPLVAMIHPQTSPKRFRDVRGATVTIFNGTGVEVVRAALSDQFGDFVGVQMGSLMIDADGHAGFAAFGIGFKGDFNSVLAHYS